MCASDCRIKNIESVSDIHRGLHTGFKDLKKQQDYDLSSWGKRKYDCVAFIPEEITRRISRSGKSKRIVKGIWLFLYFAKGNFSNVPEALSGISSKKMSFST